MAKRQKNCISSERPQTAPHNYLCVILRSLHIHVHAFTNPIFCAIQTVPACINYVGGTYVSSVFYRSICYVNRLVEFIYREANPFNRFMCKLFLIPDAPLGNLTDIVGIIVRKH